IGGRVGSLGAVVCRLVRKLRAHFRSGHQPGPEAAVPLFRRGRRCNRLRRFAQLAALEPRQPLQIVGPQQ
ncbi:MAG: hypothetical protein ACK559_42215, partial [bacterium]